MPGHAFEDDPSITDAEKLLRRIAREARNPLPEEPAHGIVYGPKKQGGIAQKLRDTALWVRLHHEPKLASAESSTCAIQACAGVTSPRPVYGTNRGPT